MHINQWKQNETRGPWATSLTWETSFSQSYNFITRLIWRGKNTIISHLITEQSFFVKPWVPFTQECFAPCLVEISPVVIEKKSFKFCNVFLVFLHDVPLEKGMALYLNKLESPPPKDALCQFWLKLAQWFLRRRCENVKSLQADIQTDRQTDRRTDRQTTHNRWSELSTQVSSKSRT